MFCRLLEGKGQRERNGVVVAVNADSSPPYEVRVTEPAEVEIESAYIGRMQFGLEAADRLKAQTRKLQDRLGKSDTGEDIKL